MPDRLPIDDILPQLLAALKQQPNAVVRAPTGSGKTTRVPPALFDAGLGRILVIEPRRLAARAAARRVAQERGERVGEAIGYHVRFDRCCGKTTRLIYATPGVLLRYLHDDPLLDDVSAVVFDEFHERGIENDLALGLVRHIQREVRPELQLLAMSATLDDSTVAAFLGNCRVHSSEGRLHPVEIVHQPKPDSLSIAQAAAQAVERLLQSTDGDILVFLPGWSEIRATGRELADIARDHNLLVAPLHGDLPAEEQDRALMPQRHRRVVLATNVAETSVTVEGITGVVDCGLARQLQFDAAIGLDRLEIAPISRASADQRAGRAGRTQPGVCIRLWSELQHRARLAQTPPEIRRVDLSGAVLQLLALDERDLSRFPWFEPPPAAAIAQARVLLGRLGALENDQLTELGRMLARLPVTPRLGRLLVEARNLGATRRGALAAALLTEREPFTHNTLAKPAPTESDLLDRVEALEAFEISGADSTRFGTIQRDAARYLFRVRDHLVRAVGQECGANAVRAETDAEPLLRSILAAFPDRLARRREPGSNRGVMVGGRGVRLAPSSGVVDAELFVCLDVDAGEGEAWVRQASAVRRDWLPAGRITSNVEIEFNAETECVESRRFTLFEDLLLAKAPVRAPDASEVERILVAAAAAALDKIRPAVETPAGSFLTRVRWLGAHVPDLGLPALEDADIRALLPWLCTGCKSFAELRNADWLGLLQSLLTHAQLLALEREAPDRLAVPSGSKIRLQYEPGRPPVLAVRIQELFGLAQTPRLACGKVRVLLHLLAPNSRPQQVTDDLASFWKNTYPQVRKELRARYPKHDWPDDPLTAPPQRGAKRRK